MSDIPRPAGGFCGENALRAVDLFAGPGGWSEAMRQLGLREVGIEWDAAACATRRAAGHLTIRADVSKYPTAPFVGKVQGVIASPPCPTFSDAGKGEGRDELPHLHVAAEHIAHYGWIDPWKLHTWSDVRTPLVLEPLRWVADLSPEWVVCEQVPAVAPLWEQYAAIWQEDGYSVWAGVLNAADFGVPQTRKRAFVIASRTTVAHPPEPTHCQGGALSMFGEVLPWVSMADALGWGMTGRTSYTVTAGGCATGGPEPFGHAARDGLERERERSLATEGRGV